MGCRSHCGRLRRVDAVKDPLKAFHATRFAGQDQTKDHDKQPDRDCPGTTLRPGRFPPLGNNNENAIYLGSHRPAPSFSPPNAPWERIRDLVLGFEIDIAQLEYTELGPYRHSVPKGVLAVLTKHDIAFRSVGRRREFGFNQMFPEGSDFGHSGADWRRLFRQEILWCRTLDQVHVMSESDGRFLAHIFPDGTDRIPQLDRHRDHRVNILRRSVTTTA